MLNTDWRKNPYPGLAPYSIEDRIVFFGRDEEIKLLVNEVIASPVTVLYGASGVGKSSVLNAGVVPGLQGKGFAIIVANQSVTIDEVFKDIKTQMAELSNNQPVDDQFLTPTFRSERDAVVLLDQFEDLFINGASPSTLMEISELLSGRDSVIRVIISIRDDFLSQLDVFHGRAARALAHRIRLEGLSVGAARAAIVGPIEASGISAEPELVEAVIDQVRFAIDTTQIGDSRYLPTSEATVEPAYLQLIMRRIWDEEARTGSSSLRLSTLKSLSGGQRVVNEYFYEAMSELNSHEREIAANIFRYLVTPTGRRIRQTLADLAAFSESSVDAVKPIIDRLVKQHVIRRMLPRDLLERCEIGHDLLASAALQWSQMYRTEETARHVTEKALVEMATQTLRFRRIVWILAVAATIELILLGVFLYTWRH